MLCALSPSTPYKGILIHMEKQTDEALCSPSAPLKRGIIIHMDEQIDGQSSVLSLNTIERVHTISYGLTVR